MNPKPVQQPINSTTVSEAQPQKQPDQQNPVNKTNRITSKLFVTIVNIVLISISTSLNFGYFWYNFGYPYDIEPSLVLTIDVISPIISILLITLGIWTYFVYLKDFTGINQRKAGFINGYLSVKREILTVFPIIFFNYYFYLFLSYSSSEYLVYFLRYFFGLSAWNLVDIFFPTVFYIYLFMFMPKIVFQEFNRKLKNIILIISLLLFAISIVYFFNLYFQDFKIIKQNEVNRASEQNKLRITPTPTPTRTPTPPPRGITCTSTYLGVSHQFKVGEQLCKGFSYTGKTCTTSTEVYTCQPNGKWSLTPCSAGTKCAYSLSSTKVSCLASCTEATPTPTSTMP